MAEALIAAEAIGDKGPRAQAFGSLALYLVREQRFGVLAEALGCAEAIGDPEAAVEGAERACAICLPESVYCFDYVID
jgi:hypothetical protein